MSKFGSANDSWHNMQNSRETDELKQWKLDQGIPLSVYIERENQWEFVDYFNEAGPLMNKDDILEIDLGKLQGDEVKIKLSSGILFWEIDYVAMDFSNGCDLKIHKIPVESAVDEKSQAITDLLKERDDLYYGQPEIGNEALLAFNVPELRSDLQNTAFLHSSGHYKILREYSGKPEIISLNAFREPGYFSRFSREQYLQLKDQLVGN